MIETHEQFEAAFEKVLAWIAHPPATDTPEDAEFQQLLQELSAYRHTLPQPPPEHPAAVAFAALEDELADFRHRHPGRLHTGELSGFGFGRDVRGA